MQNSVTVQRLTYPGPTGPVDAYLARPAGQGPWPAILVIQEVFGLVDHIEDMARRFTAEGYLALVPDLYCHDPVRKALTLEDIEGALDLRRTENPETALAQLAPERREPVQRAAGWLANRDSSTYLPDLHAALAHLKQRPDIRGGVVGAIGYCMGGGLSGRLASSGADLAAAVVYYGGIPPIEEVPNIRCPVLGNYGGEDHGITSRVPDLEAAMTAHGKDFVAHIYDGAPHAFANDTRFSYHPEATRLAWQRTLDFFERHLKGAPVGAR